MRLLALLCALLLAPAARAQSEACTPYSHPEFQADMDAADKALSDFDLPGARRQLADTQKKVRCIDAIVKPSYLARFSRQIALVFFFDQDEDSTRRWGLLSRYAFPDLPWPADFPPDHPFREALEFAEDPPMGGPADKGLLWPPKGGIFMNGKFLTEAKARAEVPSLMQVADKKGLITDAFWQDGAAFPEHVLGPPAPAPEPPKWFVPEDASGSSAVAAVDETLFEGFVEPEPMPEPKPVPAPVPAPEPVVVAPVPAPDPVPAPRPAPEPAPEPDPVAVVPDPEPEPEPIVRPVVEPVPRPDPAPKPDPVVVAPRPDPVPVPVPDPVPDPDPIRPDPVRPPGGAGLNTSRLVLGGGLAVAAGGLYALGGVTRGSFFKSEDGDALAGRRTVTNLLVLGAGVTGAAAVGVGVTAFVSTDGAAVGFNGRF